jgi:hypothetical protein
MRPEENPVLGIVGQFQRGKSTLVNCLLDDCYAPTGKGMATTKALTSFRFGESEEVLLRQQAPPDEEVYLDRREDILDAAVMGRFKMTERDRIEVRCWKPLLECLDLLDTPGFNADERDDRVALAGIDQSDMLIVLLADNDISEPESRLIDAVVERNKPFVVLVNCREMVDNKADPRSEQVEEICGNISGQICARGWTPVPVNNRAVWPCNLLWAWHAQGHLRREADATDVERSKAARQKLEKIRRHFELNHGRPVPNPRDLMARSCFLPIRQMLRAYCRNKLPEKQYGDMLNGLGEKWQRALRRALESAL